MTELDSAELDHMINFWESRLWYDRFLMEPSTVYGVERTIKFLKELKQLRNDIDAGKHDRKKFH